MIVLDTHVLVWWVGGNRKRLSRRAGHALEQHGKRNELLVSTVTLFELVTLERRGRLRLRIPVTEWLSNLKRLPEYILEPVTDDIAERAGQFGDTFPADPADRLIAATSLVREVPLVTHDARLQGAAILSTIW